MKTQVQSFWFLSVLALFLSLGLSLNAQTTPQPAQQPDAQSQPAQQPQAQPAQQPQAQPSQPSDQSPPQATESSAQPSQATGAQFFTGTVVKSGDKYMFQEEATGKTYDIDHQDDVQKFEGKKVKVHGTLDASGKILLIQ